MMKLPRKVFVSLALAAGISAPIANPALAVPISNLSGQSCGDACGTWHFINNQTGGAAAGTLTATWSSTDLCIVGASKVNSHTQHFICSACGALTSASTNLPGRLVLSDFSCGKTPEPPK